MLDNILSDNFRTKILRIFLIILSQILGILGELKRSLGTPRNA